jgi:L-rhamnose-H+ transport protein
MIFASTTLTLGIALAIIAGIMGGAFAMPMKYMGRWSWENVWAIFILVSCVLMPVIVVKATIPGFVEILRLAPAGAVASAILTGLAWGFGAIMFGQGVCAIGVAMGSGTSGCAV